MNQIIFRGILACLQAEKGRQQRLLDASAGAGESSASYRAMGFEVVATNYDPAGFNAVGIPCIRADLNEPWPFESASFDIVVLQEVIEHLESVPHVFREAGRILRPRGCLVLSTPNMLNCSSRVRFLLTGFYQGRKKPMRLGRGLGDAGNWHVLPFHVYQWVAHETRFDLEKVLGTRWRWNSLLLGFFYPLAATYAYLGWVTAEKDATQKRFNQQVWKGLFSPAVLFGTNLVMKFRKRD